MNDYLAKPVRAPVLKSMLEEYLKAPSAPIPDIQGTATGLAKSVMAGVQNGTEKEKNATHRPRPSFEKRMSSRNLLPFHGKDPQEDASETTPRAVAPRERPPSSRSSSSATITNSIEEDASVPPLSLGDTKLGNVT